MNSFLRDCPFGRSPFCAVVKKLDITAKKGYNSNDYKDYYVLK